MTKNSLALRSDRIIDDRQEVVVPIRFSDGHVHRLALLALAETAIAGVSVHLGVLVRLPDYPKTIWPEAFLVAIVMLISLASMGLYQLRQRVAFTGILARVLIAVLISEAALGLIFYLVPSIYVGRGVMLVADAFMVAGLALVRYFFLRLVDEEIFKRRVLVWGAGARAATIGKRLRRRADQRGFKIVGYVRTAGDASHIPDHDLLRHEGGLLRLAIRHRVEEIVVAMDDRRGGLPTAELLECRLRGVKVCDILAFLERESGRVSVGLMQPSWLIFSNGFACDSLRATTKRVFDVVVSIGVLLVVSPLAVLTAMAIFLEDRGPILYRQVRTGQYGRLFSVFKFRSMRFNAEADGQAVWAAKSDARVTKVGAWIRKLRIDELPQIANVLLGHMSFVGPRPERPEFVRALAESIPYYAERHSVKPGITGWAQVRYSYGASEKDAQEKLEYDLYYVKHHSLAFDLMVLLQTVEIVLFRIGSR
jgi:sugar transferase (PEP-CTERM system associated)